MTDHLLNTADHTLDRILTAMTPEIRSDKKAWPAPLLELVSVLAAMFMDTRKMAAGTAARLAQDLVTTIAWHIGGRAIYLPRDERLPRAIKEILEARSQGVQVDQPEQPNWYGTLAVLVDAVAGFFDSQPEIGDGTVDTIQAIAHLRGGRAVYLPRNTKLQLAVRDRAVRRAFTGDNHLDLAQKAGLTPSRIYTIVNNKQSQGRRS